MRSILLSMLAVSAALVIAGCSPVEPGEEPEDDASADDADQAEEDTDEAASELVAWCDDTLTWNSSWTTLENSVITLVNQKRAAGAVCGGVSKPPVPALTKDTRLRCAARKHSKDMGKNNFFSHTGSNGSTFAQRITKSGYTWTAAGENIAAGQTTAAAVVNAWMSSTGHCNNIMSSKYKHIGVGYYYNVNATYDHYWTQDFGKQ
jgi:uncharacterized protein YkwD